MTDQFPLNKTYKIYIDETNLGDVATKADARFVVERLQAIGWDVIYGDSTLNQFDDDAQADEFDADFYQVLEDLSYKY